MTAGAARARAANPATADVRIEVQIAASAPGIPRKAQLQRWARAALGSRAQVTVRIVDGREARALNRRYRHKDYATNVLSFTYASGRETLGDVVLCAPVVSREALEQHKPVDAHYAHLTVHGMLHLRGHDHETAATARAMEGREKRILRGLGYPDPYL